MGSSIFSPEPKSNPISYSPSESTFGIIPGDIISGLAELGELCF